MLLKRNGSMKKSTGNLKIHWDKWKLKDNLPKSTGVPKSVLRVKFIDSGLLQKQEKSKKKKKKKKAKQTTTTTKKIGIGKTMKPRPSF